MTALSQSNLETLPKFSQIEPQNIVASVEQAIQRCKETIEQVLKQEQYDWENLIAPIDQVDDQLSRLWSPISHMNSVVSSDALREAHDACLPLLSAYGTWVGQHKGLYQAYLSIQQSEAFSPLSEAQRKVIDNAIRDFTLSGVALEDDKKQRYGEIKSRLSELSSTFSNNVMDATLGWRKHIIDINELKGLPESALDAARQLAEQESLEGWLFTLDIPSYLPVMTYADNAELRKEMYIAYLIHLCLHFQQLTPKQLLKCLRRQRCFLEITSLTLKLYIPNQCLCLKIFLDF
jgi:oligopeptidase A